MHELSTKSCTKNGTENYLKLSILAQWKGGQGVPEDQPKYLKTQRTKQNKKNKQKRGAVF